MDKLSIVLHKDKTAFTPRDTVRGAVEWHLDTRPRHLDLSLFWYTSGKGTRDVGVVETKRIDDPQVSGSSDFSFTLPAGPYSFSGRLISLIWAVELTSTPGSETVRREIVVSPTGQEIVLGGNAREGDRMGQSGPMGRMELMGAAESGDPVAWGLRR